ncbi:MAG: acyl carrier protein [Frankiaceae bacterium]
MRTEPSSEATEIRQQIHDYIVANFLFDCDDVADDASLIDEGVLDSIAVLEVVMFVEERLGVAVSDEEVLPEHFGSIDALTAFVERRRTEALRLAS